MNREGISERHSKTNIAPDIIAPDIASSRLAPVVTSTRYGSLVTGADRFDGIGRIVLPIEIAQVVETHVDVPSVDQSGSRKR